MASQKNQHFVPKAHLRPFTTNGDSKSISLFNIKSNRLIHAAAIKHQCAGSYFYGKDKILENLFGRLESRYAEVVRAIAAGQLSEADIDWMKLFMVLQYARTQFAVEEHQAFLERVAAATLHGKTIKEDEKPDLSHQALVHSALRQFKWMMPYTHDLKFCVVRNQTNTPLITSDNPLIFTNRFYAQKLKSDSWGVSSAGALLILPLGPKQIACLYDAGMYAIEKIGAGFTDLKKSTDVQLFNDMQFLHAHQNIYFSNPEDGDRIANEFHAVSAGRPDDKVRLIEFAAVEHESGRTKYVRIEPGKEGEDVKEKLILYQTPKPLITRWPSIMPFRNNKVAYSNGSSAGYVRNPDWLRGVKPPE